MGDAEFREGLIKYRLRLLGKPVLCFAFGTGEAGPALLEMSAPTFVICARWIDSDKWFIECKYECWEYKLVSVGSSGKISPCEAKSPLFRTGKDCPSWETTVSLLSRGAEGSASPGFLKKPGSWMEFEDPIPCVEGFWDVLKWAGGSKCSGYESIKFDSVGGDTGSDGSMPAKLIRWWPHYPVVRFVANPGKTPTQCQVH
jgi:hypothetical protein